MSVAPTDAVRHFLHSLEKPARILVAVSGGSDSTGLLLALHRNLPPGVFLCAATVDHGLRPESGQEAQAVARLCGLLGVPHRICRWEGEKPATGLSAAAREARYRLLAQAASEFSASVIVTAHTAGDQAETALMRAARDAGPDNHGLAGMADAVLYARRHWIARPFLTVEREAIRAYLAGLGQGWIEDPSNADPAHERVRVRLALAGGAAAPDTAAAAARRVRLVGDAALWLDRHVRLQGGALARIDAAGLAGDGEVLRFALSGLLALVGGRVRGPSGDSMARLAAFLESGRPGSLTAGRVLVDRRRDGLYLLRELRGLPETPLPPGAAALWDGRFSIENGGALALVVGPREGLPGAAPDALFPGVPGALARRAAGGLPRIVAAAERTLEVAASGIERAVGPYDTFLPRFDLAFADALARLAGRPPYLRPAFS